MIKLLNFMRKHKVCMSILSTLVFVVPLIIVHFLFKMECKIAWLQSEWSAGDVLAYIAGFEAFIGTVSLGFLALWQNYQIQEQHIESQEPLLSMNLIDENSILYLVIENTGGVEAKDIDIKVVDICNNGDNGLFLDGLFDVIFELYPKEKVKGRIAFSGTDIATEIFPQIKLKVSYTRPDLKRRKEYERTVTYSGNWPQTINVDKNDWGNRVAYDADKIARANVRIANYLDGHQVAKIDELEILANRSLKNDLVDAIRTKQQTPIYDRTQTIYKSSQAKSKESEDNG